MNALLRLVQSTDWDSERVAIPIAIAVLAAAVALLPSGQRVRARQGAALLALSIVCDLARFLFREGSTIQRLLLFVAAFALPASIGRSLVLLVLEVFGRGRLARNSPRIFQDLSTAVVYMFVALVALRTIDVEPGSILTTSALLTAVAGLAMQDTLGNLVSGLALQMQRPFDVGDWIEVDSPLTTQQAGRVTEVTWRATTVITPDHVELSLPNAMLARAAIRNHSRPSPTTRRRAVIAVPYAVSPADVHAALLRAAEGIPGVLASPPPLARTRSLADSKIEYELLYFIDDFGEAARIEGTVLDRVYDSLKTGPLGAAGVGSEGRRTNGL
jgi:small-conductance mechanosensitive channel